MRSHPCKKNCPRRAPGCGAICQDWQIYVNGRNEEYEDRIRQHKLNEAVFDSKIKSIRKNFNRRRK